MDKAGKMIFHIYGDSVNAKLTMMCSGSFIGPRAMIFSNVPLRRYRNTVPSALTSPGS